jgi:hypothetical protein
MYCTYNTGARSCNTQKYLVKITKHRRKRQEAGYVLLGDPLARAGWHSAARGKIPTGQRHPLGPIPLFSKSHHVHPSSFKLQASSFKFQASSFKLQQSPSHSNLDSISNAALKSYNLRLRKTRPHGPDTPVSTGTRTAPCLGMYRHGSSYQGWDGTSA